jgi:hypothetical protein
MSLTPLNSGEAQGSKLGSEYNYLTAAADRRQKKGQGRSDRTLLISRFHVVLCRTMALSMMRNLTKQLDVPTQKIEHEAMGFAAGG